MNGWVCVLIGSLALATAACGSDTDGGGAGGGGDATTSATGTGATATGATTTSTGGTTSTTSTGTGGGGCCKVIDDAPGSCPDANCGGCVNNDCSQPLAACEAIQGCHVALETFLSCMCDAQEASDMAAEDACISAFEGSSAEAAALIGCVEQSCVSDCTL